MKNLVMALEDMHRNKIVHRDLKPENLILASKESDFDIKIADFGLASFVKEGELLTLRCGTPGYAAPELLNNEGYNEKADIFSAGILMFILLSGKSPFFGNVMNEVIKKNK